MKVVVDTNILISALIDPEGKLADILLQTHTELELYSCYFLYIEILKHKNKLVKLSGLPESELLELIYHILKKIRFINEEQIPDQIWRKAFEMTQDIDEKDTPFVALTLYLKSFLWTGDKILIKGLKERFFDNVLTSQELLNKLRA